MTDEKSSFVFRVFRKTVQRHGLLKPGEKVLVAFSGGPDSTALVFLFRELSLDWGLELCLGHFNHKLRAGAGLDETFVRETAGRLGLPLFVGQADVRAEARRRRWNLEEAARNLRYAFLKKTARETGAGKIATGHTRTDQAETFLIRLLRGSGRRGLAGIYPAVDDVIIRPLIEVERKHILEYLKERGIACREDESNRDRRFLRNRIRLDLLPELRRKYTDGVVSRLARAADILREEERFLEELTEKAYAETREHSAAGTGLNMTGLSGMDPALARRVVRKYLEEVKGNLRDVTFEDVEALLRLKNGDTASFRNGLYLTREGNAVIKKEKDTAPAYNHLWDGQSALEVKEAEKILKGKILNRQECRPEYDDSRRVFLDRDRLRFPLRVRSRREGDRYRPLNAPGRRKLKEMMRERSIRRRDRDRLPVFLSKGEVVWAAGLPAADAFKITPATQRVFMIEISDVIPDS